MNNNIKINFKTHFVKISKSDRNLTIVAQDVLDGSLRAIHNSVGYSLSETGVALGLLLYSEEEDDRLDGDALIVTNIRVMTSRHGTTRLEEDSPVDHG